MSQPSTCRPPGTVRDAAAWAHLEYMKNLATIQVMIVSTWIGRLGMACSTLVSTDSVVIVPSVRPYPCGAAKLAIRFDAGVLQAGSVSGCLGACNCFWLPGCSPSCPAAIQSWGWSQMQRRPPRLPGWSMHCWRPLCAPAEGASYLHVHCSVHKRLPAAAQHATVCSCSRT